MRSLEKRQDSPCIKDSSSVGLCHLDAPVLFQLLMQRVISGLNPCEGPDFVCAYIDDLLVFSHSLKNQLRWR